MGNYVGVFGFVWNRLEIFDLDGHNLGTVPFKMVPTIASFLHNLIPLV
jgi:hypothetical protein